MVRIRKKLWRIDIKGVGTEAWPRETVSAGPASTYCRSRQLFRHCSAALLVAIKLAGFSKSIVGEAEMPFLPLPCWTNEFLDDNLSGVNIAESCQKGLPAAA